MKRFFTLLATLSLGLGTHAFAWTGGPFDNGDYSILIERGGVYQATFSFRNGSGMALFNENNSFEPATGTTVTGMFSINNRSVFYYKGVTYFGVATGIVDVDARRVTGFTNGSSDYYSTTAPTVGINPSPGGGTTPAGQANTGSSRPGNIGYNGNVGYIANSTFTAKITSTRPILRFRGTGTATFMGFPDLDIAANRAAELADNAGITTANELMGRASNPDVLTAFQDSVRMRVYGSRRFF